MRAIRPHRLLAGLTAAGLIGGLSILTPTAAMSAPAPVVLDTACGFMGIDVEAEDIVQAVGVSPDVPITLEYDSPADLATPPSVDITFGAGIVNELDDELSGVASVMYSVDIVTEDGDLVGGGASDAIEIDPALAAASGSAFGAFPTGTVEIELSKFAAGRTLYLQPAVFFANAPLDVLESDDLEAEIPENFTFGLCAPGDDFEELTLVEDFPLVVNGDPIAFPLPGEQSLSLPTTPVEAGKAIDASVAGFLPYAPLIVQECPADDPTHCSDEFTEPDDDDLIELPIESLSRFARSSTAAPSGLQRSAHRLLTSALEDEFIDSGFTIISTDGDGNGAATLIVGDEQDFCGPDAPCDLVASDAFDAAFTASAALTFVAEDPAMTPAPETTAPTTDEPAGAALPETGSHVVPLAWSGFALALAGTGLVMMSARRRNERGALHS